MNLLTQNLRAKCGTICFHIFFDSNTLLVVIKTSIKADILTSLKVFCVSSIVISKLHTDVGNQPPQRVPYKT